MQKPLDEIIATLQNSRRESDGSITADCTICSTEGHQNKRLRLFCSAEGRITGISCSRFASAGISANRDHCKPISEMVGIGAGPVGVISEPLFAGTLTLRCEPADRGKVCVTATNCNATLARDVIDINKSSDRAQFVRALEGLDDGQKKDIHKSLLRLADQLQSVQEAVSEETETEAVRAIFSALPDGRLIEQIAGGLFALYDPQKGAVSYARRIETDTHVYQPLEDDFIARGGLFLPDHLAEYEDDATLDSEIETCIKRYSDVPERECRLSARYVRLSYIADKLNEISYLRAIGERGSGKSRYIGTTGMLCFRPVLATSPSAASLYRVMDAYSPTLTIDECNLAAGSEDTDAMLQILNSGFQRLTSIPRIEKAGDGQMTVKMFSPFGPKLIGGLKLSDSGAFESRCVQVSLQKTTRKDIPFRMTARMLSDFADLRAKLYLWRLRNWSRDFEQALDLAEKELKEYSIEPRFVQIAIPVYGLISDSGLKRDFARMLEGRTDDAASEKQLSFDGQLAGVVHRLLFEVDDENQAVWKDFGNYPEPEEGKPIELATVEQIAAVINDGLPEKKRLTSVWVGRELGKLGFKRREINRRASIHWKKPAVIFDREAFTRIFGSYALPLPVNFTPVTPVTQTNVSNSNDLGRPEYFEGQQQSSTYSGQANQFDVSKLGELTGVTGVKFTGEGEESLEATDSCLAEPPALVALDTETEPFDERRRVTPRTAKMIGLAICHGGEEADYVTDQNAWALMMPEPDQTVLFHNAKFDLLKLRQSGLALPEKWEDTLIAAHLLNETGEHGLKPLAKTHLGIEDPVTFEEADRMRLLDPEIFEEYAKNDARYTRRLWPIFEPEIDRQELRDVYELEKSIVLPVMAMEEAGMKIDLSRMHEMARAVKDEIKRIETDIHQFAGCQFDLGSPEKVSKILFDKLGIPSAKKTKGGQRSVDREALDEVRGHHPIVEAILEYREIDKLASTFLSVLPKFADSRGRIHPEFRPLGAKTGRFSCSNPNVQQIPARSDLGKKLRQLFVCEEGNALVVADWSQMELRILAHYSKDPLLLQAYTSETETDLHTLTAARMFGKEEADVSKSERSIAKMINFGIAYGITPIGLYNRLKPSGAEITPEDCEQFIRDYFKTYSGVKAFLNRVEVAVKRRGYIKNLFGRRRRLSGESAREIRQAQNFIIQATAADLAKKAMARLYNELPEGARMIAMVHDEFIVECRTEQAEAVRSLMVEVMQAVPEGFTVPMVVEAKIGGNWGECK